jgi:hypothetical protein
MNLVFEHSHSFLTFFKIFDDFFLKSTYSLQKLLVRIFLKGYSYDEGDHTQIRITIGQLY